MKKLLSILLSLSILCSLSVPYIAYSATNANPVIKGSYADPDIDYFDCKYWIFPTTDGNPGWAGTQFHAFSSEDLVNWTDEGVILDVANKNPGKNIKGVQIASSKWSEGNAWAPTIEKIGSKYYFYYCGRIRVDLLEKYAVKNPDGFYNDKAIGVAVADKPTGPYKALDEPILYPAMIRDMGLPVGQMIDPSVFIDDDGTPYLFFGNSVAYSVKLNANMTSIKKDTIVKYNIWEFVESLVVFKRNGLYYFTWSDFGTGDERYCVKYATVSDLSRVGDLDKNKVILQMDRSKSIFGTGHQSILYQPNTDQYFIAYGRHQTKNGVPVADPGNFREVCIDEFDFTILGDIKLSATNTGVAPVSSHKLTTRVVKPTCTAEGSTQTVCSVCSKVVKKTNVTKKTAHTYVKQSSINPTYAKAGKTVYKCKNCIASYTQAVPKLTVSKPSSVSLSSKSKSFVLKWKKNTKATGYQIQYSTDKAFKKGVKSVNIKKNSTTSKTVKSLKSKKTYYVRIRAYKTYNKKNYYSSWVSKSVKTK